MTLRMDLGEDPPDRDQYDVLWVMGGAQQVWQHDEHAWLRPEMDFIRREIEAGTPYLGVCLGHQLLAEALGGKAGPADTPEIGIYPLRLTQAGESSAFYTDTDPGRALQWHLAEVKTLPPGARALVESDGCGIQAMSMAETVLSIQYHAEVTAETLPAWCQSETAVAMLNERFGSAGPSYFQRITREAMPGLNGHARQLFANWFDAAERSLGRKGSDQR